jgi:MFS family permease
LPHVTAAGGERPSRRGGRALAVEGLFQSIAQGLGETYLNVLAVWLGAPAPVLGLVAALPTTVASTAQAAARHLHAGGAGARRFIAGCWTAQGAALALIGSCAFIAPDAAIVALCGLAATAFALGGLSVPAWTTLVFHAVPRGSRGWFFGLRGVMQQAGVLVAIVGGGLLLARSRVTGVEAWGFVQLFIVAGVARAAGAAMLAGIAEPVAAAPRPVARSNGGPWLGSHRFRRLAFYLWGLRFGTSVATPCFVPYMLRELQWSYLRVAVILAVPALVKTLTVRGWGRLADRVGPGPMLRASGWLVVPSAALWLVSESPWWIAAAQVYAGLVWGAQELAQASAIVETTHGRERSVGLFNFVDGGMIVTGSLAGGVLAWLLDGARPFGSGFLFAMAASTALRAAPAVALLWRVRGIGRPRWSHVALPLQLWAIRPSRGPTVRPWPDLPPEGSEPAEREPVV